MVLKPYLINSLASLLLSKSLFDAAKTLVQDASGQSGLTGEEKKAKVKADLASVFGQLGSAVLNLAIELAVAWVNSQTPKQK